MMDVYKALSRALTDLTASEEEAKALRRVVRVGIVAVLVQLVAMTYMAYAHREALKECAPIIIVSPDGAQQVRLTPWSAYPNRIPPRKVWRV